MVTATLTSKGQLTIPKAVRDSLGLHAGDRVTFEVADSQATMRPMTKSVDEVFGKLSSEDQPVYSVEEMNAALAERFRTGDT